MALQTTGPISLGDVQTEFGGSNPISLNEYYSADTGVPSSGAISLANFYGTSDAPTYTYSDTVTIFPVSFGSNQFGCDYLTSNGSTTPQPFSAPGYTLYTRQAYYQGTGSTRSFVFSLTGNHAQTMFEGLILAYVGVIFTTNAARSYNSATNRTIWSWTNVGYSSLWETNNGSFQMRFVS